MNLAQFRVRLFCKAAQNLKLNGWIITILSTAAVARVSYVIVDQGKLITASTAVLVWLLIFGVWVNVKAAEWSHDLAARELENERLKLEAMIRPYYQDLGRKQG